MSEIPQKGWYVVKEGNDPRVTSDLKVYLDGKMVGGIQKLSLEIDAAKLLPILKLEVVAFGGLVWNTAFGDIASSPMPPLEPDVFRSSSSPEEILKAMMEKAEPEPKTDPESEVL